LSLALAVAGIFIPGLPVTPFLLLTAWFYVRSSENLYKKLVNNRIFGKYILRFRKNKGITLRTKIYSIVLMWTMILVSTIFMIKNVFIIAAVLFVGLIGTVVMGFKIKTVEPDIN